MKRLLTILVASAALATVVVPAGATKPEISRYGFSVSDRIGSSACGFPIRFVVRGKGQTLTFRDHDGEVVRALATGPISIVFTNPASGVTARYSISGPSFYDADGRLVRGTGRWFVVTADGEPAIAIGNLVFDSDGVPKDPARTIDVCDALS